MHAAVTRSECTGGDEARGAAADSSDDEAEQIPYTTNTLSAEGRKFLSRYLLGPLMSSVKYRYFFRKYPNFAVIYEK